MKKLLLVCMVALLLCAALPALAETATFGDVTVDTTAEYVDLGENKVSDYNALYAFLDQLPQLRQLDMFETPIRLADADALTERYPQVSFGWSLRVAARDHSHVIRTDSTAYCVLHSNKTVPHSSKDFEVLKYCPNMLALDLGHNTIDDLSFLRYMPHLKVLIVACNQVTDITPIGELTELQYLEVFKNNITDISPLANCKELLDLNICFNRIKDWSPLYGLDKLERLWIYNSNNYSASSPVPKEVVNALKEHLPDTHIDSTSYSTLGGWRDHPRYDVLYEMFYTDPLRNGIHGNGTYVPFETEEEDAGEVIEEEDEEESVL